ncbi:unnamed protein product [Oppiella nova]|uniref:Arginine-hydroxylase NDUFAF5, mitochondrial n=1 Tax=Oppiella nova TaxID=334625 RepID=A0A7R9LD14_9ACAR|nr:unnamed protein product [Oppiella nova]CAG2161764.1 unnamed protein product [Oppiella nova]
MHCLSYFVKLRPNVRHFSAISSYNIFDSKTKRLQREVAIDLDDNQKYDYLKDEIAYRVVDRVYDIKRHFPLVVDFGSQKGLIAKNLSNETYDTLICCDSSHKCLQRIEGLDGIETISVVIDEEEGLPFRDNSIDLVISSLSMHWINDLPKAFAQIHRCLKSDGVFIGAMFGGQTLFELRSSLQMAEQEREGGFGPHVSPFITAQDMGSLLTRSGYNLITVDTDEIKVNYPTIFELMYDLKGMAENNALVNRKSLLRRDSLLASAAIYQTLYGNTDGSIAATFQIFYFIGWKPDPSHRKPLERGSAQFSLKDIPNLDKILKDTENKS